MPFAPKRRWSFSLRALFVVVAVLGSVMGSVVYELNWIRQRHDAFIRWNAELAEGDHRAPGLLWIFNEPNWVWIGITFPPREGAELTASEVAEVNRLAALFPEAH